MAPEGFFLDDSSGLYYQTEIEQNERGIEVQWVTWFNTETGEYKQESYPLQPEEKQHKKPVRNKKTTILLIAAMILVALTVIFVCIFIIPHFQEQNSQSNQNGEWLDIENQVSDSMNKETQQYESKLSAGVGTVLDDSDVMNQTNNREASNETEETQEIAAELYEQWPNFPQVNIYYMYAKEDAEYVYFLRMDDQNWRDRTPESNMGSLYRMPKDNASGEIEKVLAPSMDGLANIVSFTIGGNYIYYCTTEGDVFSYFRIPKDGGICEYIFSSDFSYLSYYDEKLYLLCKNWDTGMTEIRAWDATTKEFKTESVSCMDGFGAIGGAHQEFEVFAPFSVLDGKMYIGGCMDYKVYHGYYDLQTGTITKVTETEMPEEEYENNAPGKGLRNGYNALFFGSNLLYTQYAKRFVARMNNQLFIRDKDGVFEWYQIPDTFSGQMDEMIPILQDEWILMEQFPYAVSGSYIFFSDYIYHYNGSSITVRDWNDYTDSTQRYQTE